jgi:acyl-CoA thioesterase II
MPNLVETLALEQIELNLLRGVTPQSVGGRIFGGQVIAQCLLGAYRTLEGRACHSLHAYFIHPGDPTIPILFEVDRARDGGSFTTRRVAAVQEGRQILNFAASFQAPEEGFTHQTSAPLAPGPEALIDDDLRGQAMGFQLRTVDAPRPGMIAVARPPRQQVWMRCVQPLGEDLSLHQAALVYASDFPLLATSIQPHAITWNMPGLQRASLDHAIWFHRPFDFNQWHLYDMDSPSACATRGFSRGAIFGLDGSLVASAAQEAMVRFRSPKPAAPPVEART